MLRGLGITRVEGYGGLFDDPAGTKAILDAAGVAMPSGHVALSQVDSERAGTVALARSLGMTSVYCPYIDHKERPRDRAGWIALGERLERLATAYQAEGLRLGWHNHDFEIVPHADGWTPLQLMLTAAPTLVWEADIAWIVRGGGDPFAWITDYGDRIDAVHIKDIAPEGEALDEDGWADVGHGVIDWPALLAALAPLPVRHHVLEHDNPSDDRRFARRSVETLQAVDKAGPL